MLVIMLQLSCDEPIPEDGVLEGRCYYCEDSYPLSISSNNASIMCGSLNASITVVNRFKLYAFSSELQLECEGDSGRLLLEQEEDFIVVKNTYLQSLTGLSLRLENNNVINHIKCTNLNVSRATLNTQYLVASEIQAEQLANMDILNASANLLIVHKNAYVIVTLGIIASVMNHGIFDCNNLTGETFYASALSISNFLAFKLHNFQKETYASVNGTRLEVGNLTMKNEVYEDSNLLNVSTVNVTEYFLLGDGCALVASELYVESKFECEGNITTTKLQLTSVNYEFRKCNIAASIFNFLNSKLQYYQNISVLELYLVDSEVYFEDVQVATYEALNTIFYARNVNSTTFFTHKSGYITLTGKFTLLSAEIATTLTASQLILSPSRYFAHVHINSIFLNPVTDNFDNYLVLIDELGTVDMSSEVYDDIVKSLEKYSGTLYISPTSSLESNSILASCIIVEGSINITQYQFTQTYYAIVFNTNIEAQMNILVFNFDASSPISQCCIRMTMPIQINTFYVYNKLMIVNAGKSQSPTFTVSNECEIKESKIIGCFSYFSLRSHLQDIELVEGNFYISDSYITLPVQSLMELTFGTFGSEANITLLGTVVILNQQLLEENITFTTQLLVISNLTAYGPLGFTREGECCGGSAINLGGCSLGTPREPGQPNSGDSCDIEAQGQQSGGFVLISTETTYIKALTLNGKNSSYTEKNICSGAGSGGMVVLRTVYLFLNSTSNISLAGGDCEDFCITGGAGSAGLYDVAYYQLRVDDIISSQSIEPFFHQRDGQCKFAVRQLSDQCGILQTLVIATMKCQLNYLIVMFMCVLIVIFCFLMVWLTIHCYKSKDYVVEQQNQEYITDKQLFEHLKHNLINLRVRAKK